MPSRFLLGRYYQRSVNLEQFHHRIAVIVRIGRLAIHRQPLSVNAPTAFESGTGDTDSANERRLSEHISEREVSGNAKRPNAAFAINANCISSTQDRDFFRLDFLRKIGDARRRSATAEDRRTSDQFDGGGNAFRRQLWRGIVSREHPNELACPRIQTNGIAVGMRNQKSARAFSEVGVQRADVTFSNRGATENVSDASRSGLSATESIRVITIAAAALAT